MPHFQMRKYWPEAIKTESSNMLARENGDCQNHFLFLILASSGVILLLVYS
jgi:hypothetical protein